MWRATLRRGRLPIASGRDRSDSLHLTATLRRFGRKWYYWEVYCTTREKSTANRRSHFRQSDGGKNRRSLVQRCAARSGANKTGCAGNGVRQNAAQTVPAAGQTLRGYPTLR